MSYLMVQECGSAQPGSRNEINLLIGQPAILSAHELTIGAALQLKQLLFFAIATPDNTAQFPSILQPFVYHIFAPKTRDTE